jgi:hypothetical protein
VISLGKSLTKSAVQAAEVLAEKVDPYGVAVGCLASLAIPG